MTAPKRGDAVLVRAERASSGDHPPAPYVAATIFGPEDEVNRVVVNASLVTTEAEIRRQAFRDAAAMLRKQAEVWASHFTTKTNRIVGRLDECATLVEQMGGEEKSDADATAQTTEARGPGGDDRPRGGERVPRTAGAAGCDAGARSDHLRPER